MKTLLAMLMLFLVSVPGVALGAPGGVPGPPPGVGNAPPPPLVGNYAVTGTTACIVSPIGFGPSPTSPPAALNLGLQPIFGISTTRWTESWSVTGVFTFNGDGTGAVQVRGVGLVHTDLCPNCGIIGLGAWLDLTSPFTYTVALDGTVAVDLYAITGTILPASGVRTGQTFTIDDVQLAGRLGVRNETITLATVVPRVETLTFSGSNPDLTCASCSTTIEYKVCHRSRTLFLIE